MHNGQLNIYQKEEPEIKVNINPAQPSKEAAYLTSNQSIRLGG